MQETAHAAMDSLAEIPAGQEWIDGVSDRLQQSIDAAYRAAGDSRQSLADFLNGVWLGHPLHPVLTDLPIGFWTSTAALDILDFFGARKMRSGADATLALGIAGAVAAAAAGLTDWQHTVGRARRIGATHAVLNTAALALQGLSLLMRQGHRRSRAKMLSMAAMGIASYSAYLGGNLVFEQRVGVDHAPKGEGPKEFTRAAAFDELVEDQPKVVELEGVPVMLVRQAGSVFALASTCAHLGGPLAEGQIDGNCVVCPWHGSRFRLDDGMVEHGPSAFSQPAFETRVVDGQVEIRQRRE